jgi:hypothetical protein
MAKFQEGTVYLKRLYFVNIANETEFLKEILKKNVERKSGRIILILQLNLRL